MASFAAEGMFCALSCRQNTFVLLSRGSVLTLQASAFANAKQLLSYTLQLPQRGSASQQSKASRRTAVLHTFVATLVVNSKLFVSIQEQFKKSFDNSRTKCMMHVVLRLCMARQANVKLVTKDADELL